VIEKFDRGKGRKVVIDDKSRRKTKWCWRIDQAVVGIEFLSLLLLSFEGTNNHTIADSRKRRIICGVGL
jgi:hypothetical protein